MPVLHSRNSIGVKIETGLTFKANRERPCAFAILTLSATNGHGRGQTVLYLLNATDKLKTTWETVIRSSAVPGIAVHVRNDLALPFSFVCPFADAAWEAADKGITLDMLTESLQSDTNMTRCRGEDQCMSCASSYQSWDLRE